MRTGLQLRQAGLDQQRRTLKVHLEGLLPSGRRLGPDRLGQSVGRIVDHHVDPAETVHRGSNESLDCVEIAHMGGHPERLEPGIDQMDLRGRASLGRPGRHHHPRTRTGQPLSDRPPDPPRAASNDGSATRQVEQAAIAVRIHARAA